MPSHIFTRLGLWDEAIRANRAAEAAARHFIARHSLPGAWDQQLHAMDYLAYAYLQSARDAEARGVVEALDRIARVEPVNPTSAYAFTAIAARYVLERRSWAEAAALELSPNARAAIPWDRFPWAEAAIHFARAVGAARSGNVALARAETASLQALQATVRVAPGEYDWSRQVEIQRRIAAAWLAWADGRGDEAAVAMQAAATLDDATEKHPVSPGSILPAREQLGDLMLELGRPAEALAAYETALHRAPNRFGGLYGAARSARLTGDAAKARLYYGRLLEVARGDGRRVEHEEAQTVLAARRASR
jgi:tetratricopeptide (TPR) repeat protein